MRVGYYDSTFGALGYSPWRSAAEAISATGDNLGNLAFLNATAKIFSDSRGSFGWGSDGGFLRENFDVLIFPVANWLNSDADFQGLADLVRAADLPVMLAGLGAQSELDRSIPVLAEGTKKFVRECASRTPTIMVRGPFTAEVCESFGVKNVTVVGCPSILTAAGNSLGELIERRWSARGGKTAFHGLEIRPHLERTERRLIQLARKEKTAAIVVQHQLEFLDLIIDDCKNLSKSQLEMLNWYCDFLDPSVSAEEMKAWLKEHAYYFDSVDAWLRFLRNFSRSVNTRIHGTILSLSAGIPGICLYHDSRTKELSETLLVPAMQHTDFVEADIGIDELFGVVKFSASDFDKNRAGIALRYHDLLMELGLHPSDHLMSIIGRADASRM